MIEEMRLSFQFSYLLLFSIKNDSPHVDHVENIHINWRQNAQSLKIIVYVQCFPSTSPFIRIEIQNNYLDVKSWREIKSSVREDQTCCAQK